ncbi:MULTISPECIES: hypothetical protein [Pseudomonas syringae group]|nr:MULTISPECIES: hypothetical protein [Pseudomonas syringae group]
MPVIAQVLYRCEYPTALYRYGERDMYSPKEKEIAAIQSRKEWLARRQARLQADEPTMPVLEVGNIGDVLAPIPGDDRYLWPVSQWDKELIVKVPDSAPVTMRFGETITFFLDELELATNLLNESADLSYAIAPGLINDGKLYVLRYEYMNWFGNTVSSIPFLLEVDYMAPNRNQPGAAAVLPDEVIRDGLTLAYLNANDFLGVTVPHSSDMLAGDTIAISWVQVVATSFQQDYTPIMSRPVTVIEASKKDDPLVEIDSGLIKDLVQGKIGIYYRYIDRTGNLGQFSAVAELQYDLTPEPDGLQAPKVFLAMDGEIDRADAQMGVELEIPEPSYLNPQDSDQIQVIWESMPLAPFPLSAFPMVFPISWQVLSAKGALDRRDFKVAYNVLRGTSSTPSPDLDVRVDFTVAGPAPDPSTPGPINTNFPVITVKSREFPPVDNVLGPADKGQSAWAELPNNPFDQGVLLRLYWGNLRPHSVEKEIINEGVGDIIRFEIPWTVIEAGGYSDKLHIYYSTWNGVNEQESGHIEVAVKAVELAGLPEVGFPDRYKTDPPTPVPIINCCSLPWLGIKINIPFDTVNMDVDDEITIKWQAYASTDTSSPIDGTDFEFPPITLSLVHRVEGISLTIPYAELVEPIVPIAGTPGVGSGLVTYTLTKKSGQLGTRHTQVYISRKAGLSVCSEAFPGKCDAVANADSSEELDG